MGTTPLYPVQVDDHVIQCFSVDDRQLILEATIVCETFEEAKGFTQDRLRRMSEACSRYDVRTMEAITADLAEQSSS